MKRYSENMQQIYRRTPMPKCDFNKVALHFIEITLRNGCCPVNFLHIFRRAFLKNTSGWLLLRVMILRYAPNQILIASLISMINKKAVDKNVDYKITSLVHKKQFTMHVQQCYLYICSFVLKAVRVLFVPCNLFSLKNEIRVQS